MYWMIRDGPGLAQSGARRDRWTKILFQNPLNPWSHTEVGKSIAAAANCSAHHAPLRQPEWGIHDTEVNACARRSKSAWCGEAVCRLLYFDRS